MKKLMVSGILAVTLLTYVGHGYGFLDDLLGKPSGKSTRKKQEQKGQKGLLEGIGSIFGAKEKDIELFKKGLKTAQALQPIGEKEEIAIGQAVALEAFNRFGGEYQNESIVRYVNLVGKTVADVSDRPELNYHFAILNSDEQNAFAAPGGYIFVTRGLLDSLQNEAELAGVLAHEVAHVTRKHMLNTIQRGAVLSNVSELTLTAMNEDPELFSNVIDEVSDKLFDKGLDKDLEYEADVYGLEYAYRAGYNPSGLKDYLVTLGGLRGTASSRFFTTHPSVSVRINKCNEALQQYQDGDAFPFLAERFKRRMDSV